MAILRRCMCLHLTVEFVTNSHRTLLTVGHAHDLSQCVCPAIVQPGSGEITEFKPYSDDAFEEDSRGSL